MDRLFQFIGILDNFAGLTAAAFSIAIWLRMKLSAEKLQENVRVVLRLQSGEREIDLPLALKRRDLSRAELLGRLGMLPMGQKGSRFAIRALSTSAFMEGINDVVEGRSSVLVIPSTEEEINQFDI